MTTKTLLKAMAMEGEHGVEFAEHGNWDEDDVINECPEEVLFDGFDGLFGDAE